MFEMVLSKAVIITTIMAQENVAFLAVPHCLVSLLVVVAVVAVSTVLCSSNGVVGRAEPTCSRGVTRTTWSLSAGIATDQLLRQGNPKLLHGLVWQVSEVTRE